ncbi:putative phage tail protein [Yersinia aldovae]|uniref:phage tail length tape measure family protein n=1 Tax=Yersinia aldovae TaxID=29483 RepID=UPI0005E38953|nr:phage tail length tape measure family protein [Yersinia aldovae]CNJ03300.1 putative phage tail protein [Yersinia aldovae]
MAAENSTLNLALRITADLNEARQALASLTDDIKTVGAATEASSSQWGATTESQKAATEAATQQAQAQRAATEATQQHAQAGQVSAEATQQQAPAQHAIADAARQQEQAQRAVTEAVRQHTQVEQVATGATQQQAESQKNAADAALKNTQSQQALNNELNTSVAQSQRAVSSSDAVVAAQMAQTARGQALTDQEERTAQAQNAAAKAADAHAREVVKLKKDLDNLLASIDPTTKALSKLDAQEMQLRKSRKAGVIDEASFTDNLDKINGQREAIDQLSNGTEKFTLSTRGAQRELGVLVRQLARGDFRGAGENMMRLGGRAGMLPPIFSATTLAIGGTAAAVIGIGAAVISVMNDQDAFNRSIQLTGNYAGVTAGQLELMAQTTGQSGANYSQARDILNGLVSSGKFTAETLGSVSEAASAMAELTGKSADQVVGEFVKMTDSASAWASNSNEQYHWLDSATYERIKSLEDQGRKEEAVELASNAFKKAASDRLGQLKIELNWVAQGWNDVANYMAHAIQVAKGGASTILGLDSESEARLKSIADLKDRLARADKDPFANIWGTAHNNKLQQMREELVQLEADEAASRAAAKAESDRQKVEQDAIAASDALEKIRSSNLSDLDKEAEGVDDLKKKYQDMWAAKGGQDKLRDMGVTSTDGENFSGGQWDVDVKALDKTGQAAQKYNDQLQKQLDLKKANTNAAKTEYEIEHGLLKNATEEAQSDARVRAETLDEIEAQQKATKASATESKKSFAENQRFVEQLEKQATKRTEGAAALRAEEIATRNLTAEQRRAAEAANAAINAQEFGTQNTQLQIQYMRDMGDSAGAALLEVRNKYAQMRQELEASGNTEGLSLIDKLLPVAETKIRIDDLKQQIDDLFTYKSQQESSIQVQVQGGLLSELQGRQRLVELHKEVGDKVKAYLPQLKEMANQPGEAGAKVREMIHQLEGQLGKLSQAGNELTVAFRDGLQSGIESSLMGLAKGTMSLGDAVQNLAMSIVDSMAKIAAQQLAQMATSSLMGSSGGMGGMLGGLGSLFAADGGHIRGPGTTTSDSIPSMLSDNEFVTRAAVVQQPGALDFLHDFNRNGMAALAGWFPRSHHATGGLAGIPAPAVAAPQSIPETALITGGLAMPNVNVQQTLVLNAAEVTSMGLRSVEGERQVMTMLRANVPTLKQMLGVK